MRRLTFLLVPLFLFACDREPVAPAEVNSPELAAVHETSELTIPDMDWYTPMDCLGYGSYEPPDAVHWTASLLTMYFWYRYTPDGDVLQRMTAVWSDDLQFVTPSGDTWIHVANAYNANDVWIIEEDGRTVEAFHEHLIFENVATSARLKITNRMQVAQNAHGDPKVDVYLWSCNLTRPGK